VRIRPIANETTCRREGDGWVINGRKAFITGFMLADNLIDLKHCEL